MSYYLKFNSFIILLTLLSKSIISFDCVTNKESQLVSNITIQKGGTFFYSCCSKNEVKWLYKPFDNDESLAREISNHPNQQFTESKEYTVFTYSGEDFLGLGIHDAKLSDSGIYECQNNDHPVKIYLTVKSDDVDSKRIQSKSPDHGSVIENYQAFPFSAKDKKMVIIQCPKSPSEEVLLWKLPRPEIGPGAWTTHRLPDKNDSNMIEFVEGMEKVRLLDPDNPNAPKFIICIIGTDRSISSIPNMKQLYMVNISWILYEPPKLKISLVKPLPSNNGIHTTNLDQLLAPANNLKILEHHAFTLACEIKIENFKELEVSKISWLRRGRPLPQPPFIVDNSRIRGPGIIASFLYTSHYTLAEETYLNSGSHLLDGKDPVENFNCMVHVTLKKAGNLIVTSSINFLSEVIRVPKITKGEKNLFNTYVSEGDYATLKASVIGNGNLIYKVQFSKSPSDETSWKNLSSNLVRFVRTGKLMEHELTISIPSISREQHGDYRFLIFNEAGSDMVEGNIRVKAQPRIEITTSNLGHFTETVSFNATCHVSGYPLYTKEIHPSQQENFSSASISNMITPVKFKLIKTNNGNIVNFIQKPKEPKLLSYSNSYDGIKAVQEININEPLQNGEKISIECSYTDENAKVKRNSIELQKATGSSQYSVKLICAGPKSTIWHYEIQAMNNPPLRERLKFVKAIFHPINESEDSNGDKDVLHLPVTVSAEGIPLIKPDSNVVMLNKHNYQFVIENLKTNTNYSFDWSFDNVLNISSSNLTVIKTEADSKPPNITRLWFSNVENNNVDVSMYFADPCPYPQARRELTKILIYTKLVDDTRNFTQFTPKECIPKSSIGPPYSWYGDKPFVCTFKIDRVDINQEVMVATQNAYGTETQNIHVARFYENEKERIQIAKQLSLPKTQNQAAIYTSSNLSQYFVIFSAACYKFILNY